MIATSQQLMTADEFMELHGDDRGIELVNGEIVELPMPKSKHGKVCFKLSLLLGNFIVNHNLGHVTTNDSFVKIGQRGVRGPDLCYVSFKRYPEEEELPDALVPPLELCVEVRSPSDTRKAMLDKAKVYLNAGVQVVLIVDPLDLSATVLRTKQKQEQFLEDDQLTLPDILPGFSVRVGEFFE